MALHIQQISISPVFFSIIPYFLLFCQVSFQGYLPRCIYLENIRSLYVEYSTLHRSTKIPYNILTYVCRCPCPMYCTYCTVYTHTLYIHYIYSTYCNSFKTYFSYLYTPCWPVPYLASSYCLPSDPNGRVVWLAQSPPRTLELQWEFQDSTYLLYYTYSTYSIL